jgi:hypothetical protein
MAQNIDDPNILEFYKYCVGFARKCKKIDGSLSPEMEERFESPAFLDNVYPNGCKLLEGIDINDKHPICRILNACVYSDKFQEQKIPAENPAEFALTAAEKSAVDELAGFYNKSILLRDVIRLLIMTRIKEFAVKGVNFKVRVINLLPHLLTLDPVANKTDFEEARKTFFNHVDALKGYILNIIDFEACVALLNLNRQVPTAVPKESRMRQAEVKLPHIYDCLSVGSY